MKAVVFFKDSAVSPIAVEGLTSIKVRVIGTMTDKKYSGEKCNLFTPSDDESYSFNGDTTVSIAGNRISYVEFFKD